MYHLNVSCFCITDQILTEIPESLHYDSLLHSLYAAANHQHPSCQVNLISKAMENNSVKQVEYWITLRHYRFYKKIGSWAYIQKNSANYLQISILKDQAFHLPHVHKKLRLLVTTQWFHLESTIYLLEFELKDQT